MSTQYTVFWCFFMLHACTVQDAVLPCRSCQDPCVRCPTDTVCLLLKFWPPRINPELTTECTLIAHPTWQMYWKKPLGLITLSCKVGSIRLRPELALQTSEVQDGSWWISTITGIFSCFLLLLPCCASTFRQSNDDKTQNDPEDNLLFSRIQSLHHCLEVDFHDKEDWSISSTLESRRTNIFVIQYQSKILSPTGIVLVDELAESRFCGFSLAYHRLAKSLAFNLNAYSSSWTSEVSCSLSSWS